jgi:hypothetical protein
MAIILALKVIVVSSTAYRNHLEFHRRSHNLHISNVPGITLQASGEGHPKKEWPSPRRYGMLITVLTIVVDAVRASTLPLIVVTAATPGLETVIPGKEMMVPTIVPPPP